MKSICISGGKERVCLALCIAGQFRDHLEGVYPTLNGTLLNAAEFETDVYVDTWGEAGGGSPGPHRGTNLRAKTAAYDAPCESSHNCQGVSCPSNLTEEERQKEQYIKNWNKEHPRDEQLLDPGWADHYGSKLVWLNAELEPDNVTETWPVPCDAGVYDGIRPCQMPPWLAASKRDWYRSTIPNAWKMYGCHAAIAKQEKCRGREYDIIIKMRPDSKFWAGSQAQGEYLAWAARKVLQMRKEVDSNWEGVVQTDSRLQLAEQFSDKYATGTSKAMHYYLNSWSNLQNMMQSGLIGERAMGAWMRASPYPYTGRCTPASCGSAFQRANWRGPSGLDLNASIAEAVAEEATEREESDVADQAALMRGKAHERRKKPSGA
eukprot:scaffold53304_cov65-Phaeocystis_antarctica.AAC.3